jgi:hypothetical protein
MDMARAIVVEMAFVVVVVVVVLVVGVEIWNEEDDDHSTKDIENARQK